MYLDIVHKKHVSNKVSVSSRGRKKITFGLHLWHSLTFYKAIIYISDAPNKSIIYQIRNFRTVLRSITFTSLQIGHVLVGDPTKLILHEQVSSMSASALLMILYYFSPKIWPQSQNAILVCLDWFMQI